MAGLGTLWVELRARTAQFATEMKTAKEAIGEVKSALAEVSKTAAVASAAMAGVGILAVKAASDFEQTGSLVDRIFGAAAKDVKAFARTTSDELGVSLMEVTNGVTAIGAQLKNTLGDPTAAREQAKAITVLAADISAAMNIPFAETLERLQSGLRGETDAIEKLNIFIGEASLKQEALRLGITKSVEKMNEQEKTALRLSAIFRQTSDLTGAAAGEASTFAGQLSRLDAGVKNLAIDFGRELLPAATSIIHAFNGVIAFVRDLDPSFKALAARALAVGAAVTAVVAVVAGVAAAALSAAAGIGALVTALSAPAGVAFVASLGPVLGTVLAITAAVAALILLVGSLKFAWDTAGKDAKDAMKGLASDIGKVFGGVIDAIINFAELAISIPIKVLGLLAKQIAMFIGAHAKLAELVGADSLAKGLGDLAFDVGGTADAAMEFQVSLRDAFNFGAEVIGDAASVVGDVIKTGIEGSLKGLASFVEGVGDEVRKAAGTAPGAPPLKLPGAGTTKNNRKLEFMNVKLGADMESGFDKLLDMINDANAAAKAWAMGLAASAPEIADAAGDIAKKFREAEEAAAKSQTSGEGLAGVMDAIRGAGVGLLADATAQSIASVGAATAMTELRKQCTRLGISFDDVREQLKSTSFDRTVSDPGFGLSGNAARGTFNAIRGGFDPESQGSAKALSETLGGAVSSALSGSFDFSSFGSVIGAALGSAAPGIGTAMGGEVGSAVAGALEGIAAAFMATAQVFVGIAADFLGSDPRLSAAASAGAEAAQPLLGMAAAVAGISIAVAPVIASLAMLAALLWPVVLVFGSVLALCLGLSAILSALVVVVASAIAIFLAWLVAVILTATGLGAFLVAIASATFGLLAFLPVYAALFAGLGKLVMETDGAHRAMEIIALVVDNVIRALEPFGQRLVPLAGLFAELTDVFMPLISAFAESPGVTFLLFTTLKTLALVLGTLAIAVVEVGNVIFNIVATLATALAAVIDGLMPALEAAGMGDAAKELRDNLLAASAAATDMGNVDTQAMKDALDEVASLTQAGAMDRVKEEAIAEAKRRAREEADAKARENRRRAREDAEGNPLEQLQEGVFNAVADFKVDAARFAAMDAVPGQGGAGSGGAGGRNLFDELAELKSSRFLKIDNVTVVSSNPADFFDKIEKIADQRQFDQTGTKAKAGRPRGYGR